ncbi:hypothetical protein HanXRQr2_Chr13g0593671 [Helianthus annuus]|uniref:Uncharacterized protein n=1 Tax=Helianthus annuus TaxID=4232 RepID=A0A9K3HAP8_HELAN|nr:hypothetical protein HanXRQr2_Chr13g0593671 [Helianthus annuus]KAJ0849688.1 hypothetical protein HanPSC8_Chr13g0571731 [Helianthus annuus]
MHSKSIVLDSIFDDSGRNIIKCYNGSQGECKKCKFIHLGMFFFQTPLMNDVTQLLEYIGISYFCIHLITFVYASISNFG